MKIVINGCFGGFGLSRKAMKKYAELKGINLYPEKENAFGYTTYWTVPEEERQEVKEDDAFYAMSLEERVAYNKKMASQQLYDRDIARDDPMLVLAVETLGSKQASGMFAELRIVEIPDGVKWEIEENDGNEWVAEAHRTWS